jgi:hypothetical protein
MAIFSHEAVPNKPVRKLPAGGSSRDAVKMAVAYIHAKTPAERGKILLFFNEHKQHASMLTAAQRLPRVSLKEREQLLRERIG